MPEGDSVHRVARKLQVLVGERVGVETPHPRAAVSRVAERLDGRTLLGVEAAGKNLLLRFEGGLVLRSHLRMTGRWEVRERDSRPRAGTPWLGLRAAERGGVLPAPGRERRGSCAPAPSARPGSGTGPCSSSPRAARAVSAPTSWPSRP